MEHGIIYRVSFRFIHRQYYPAFAAEMSSEKGIQFEGIFIASSLIHDAWLINENKIGVAGIRFVQEFVVRK